MNQQQAILKHFKVRKTLTRAQAMSDYGICELSSRLGELQALGHRFHITMTSKVNRFGNPIKFGVYRYLGVK